MRAKPAHARDSIDEYILKPRTFGRKLLDAELKVIRDWCHNKVALDFATDEPIPRWALMVMKLERLPFNARINIIKAHNRKITKYREIKDEALAKRRKHKREQKLKDRGVYVEQDYSLARGLII